MLVGRWAPRQRRAWSIERTRAQGRARGHPRARRDWEPLVRPSRRAGILRRSSFLPARLQDALRGGGLVDPPARVAAVRGERWRYSRGASCGSPKAAASRQRPRQRYWGKKRARPETRRTGATRRQWDENVPDLLRSPPYAVVLSDTSARWPFLCGELPRTACLRTSENSSSETVRKGLYVPVA
jgi:hypothetical protein